MVERRHAAIAAFETPRYQLGDDLDRLEQVLQVRAPEAVLFYCNRILEVLCGDAVRRLTGEEPATVFASLERLLEIGSLNHARLTSFHALRRLGNDVRHVQRRVAEPDAEVAVAFEERVLDWFFFDLAVGPRLPASERWTPAAAGSELSAALAALEAEKPDLERLAMLWGNGTGEAFRRTPILPGLYADLLSSLGGGGTALALGVLDTALAWFPQDLRLRQLRGLVLRQLGRTDEALKVLEELWRDRPDDEETAGILAGTYKRLWADESRWGGRERRRQQALRCARELYEKAWRASRELNVYVGINAATLALLSGDTGRSRSLARRIVERFEQRKGRLAPGHAIQYVSYWDRVTLAEAELLCGDVEAARRDYVSAIDAYADRITHAATTIRQLELLLPALGLAPGAEAFLRPPPAITVPPPQPSASHESRGNLEGGNAMYEPKPLDTSAVELPVELTELLELLAENVHDVWARARMAEGWTYGPRRDDERRQHPDLVPYSELSASEKVYDRETARTTLRAILAMGFRIDRR